jgi:hypothetical protein
MKRILLILPLSAALLVPTYLLAQDHDQDNDDHHDDRHHVNDKHHKDYHDFDDHEDRDSSVTGAVFSRDESRILAWSQDGTARLWDARTGAQIGPALRHDSSVTGAVFSRDESISAIRSFGRPSDLPFARAVARPARTRSMIISRSNSAYCGAPQ